MKHSTDIDLDFADRQLILDKISNVPALLESGKKHNTGVYFHEIPTDPTTGLATIDHKTAEDLGFFKIDCLNVGVYKDVRDEHHLIKLMEREPQWELLEHDDFVNMLFHVNGHGELLRQLKPTSVEQLAATLAIIRPAKRHLADKDWQTIMKEVWTKPTNGEYYFKKAHAMSYAVACVVHMNLICENAT